MDWIGLAQDRDRWRTLVSAVMNLWVPWNAGNFLTSCKPVSFSRRTLHHGVSKKVIGSKIHTEDLQTLGSNVRNKVARVTWSPWFVRFWFSSFECPILMQFSYQADLQGIWFLVSCPSPKLEWHCLVVTVDSRYVKLLSVPQHRIINLLPDETPAVMAEDVAGCKTNSHTKDCSSTWDRVYGFCKRSHWRYQSRGTSFVACGCGWDIGN